MPILNFLCWFYNIDPTAPPLAIAIVLILNFTNTFVWAIGFLAILDWTKRKRKKKPYTETPINVNAPD